MQAFESRIVHSISICVTHLTRFDHARPHSLIRFRGGEGISSRGRISTLRMLECDKIYYMKYEHPAAARSDRISEARAYAFKVSEQAGVGLATVIRIRRIYGTRITGPVTVPVAVGRRHDRIRYTDYGWPSITVCWTAVYGSCTAVRVYL
jgi:hypothetical protein